MLKRTVYGITLTLLLTGMLTLVFHTQPAKTEPKMVSPGYELGIWGARSGYTIPDEASWVIASLPDYEKPRQNISVILCWYSLHPPFNPYNPFETESEINEVEEALRSVPLENFWGMLFINEEHYRSHIGFYDDVNTTWFGERLLGYPLYLEENPSATTDEWKDEMFLRMIRGFYNYFHVKGIKVGITANSGSTVPNYRNQSWIKGIPAAFGEPAMAFIRQHYDFVFLYTYSRNLEDFYWTKQYFSIIDNLWQKQKKFWILTQIWPDNEAVWEKETIALEIKNCLDRNIVVTSYHNTNPPFEETWPLIKRAIELYNSEAPYFEEYVYGKNLLTG